MVSLHLSILTSGRAKVEGLLQPQRRRFQSENSAGQTKILTTIQYDRAWHFNRFAFHCLREKALVKEKEQKGEAEHKRVEKAEYERVRKSRVALHSALGLSTDFIIGLKHITLKAKSNIKNDRRYKCGD